jgi:DNA-binding NarL/FixJ family response regulator
MGSGANGTASVNVMLAHRRDVAGTGLWLLLKDQSDIHLVGRSDSVEGTLEVLGGRPDLGAVVVLVSPELQRPGDGYWLVGAIVEAHPEAIVVGCGDGANVPHVSRFVLAGARSYLSHRCRTEEWLDGLRRAAAGELVLAGVSESDFGRIAIGIKTRTDGSSLLTARQRQVLAVAARGGTSREIAEVLGVAERTVDTHLRRIYKRLHVPGRVAAISAAVRLGLIDVDLTDDASYNAR